MLSTDVVHLDGKLQSLVYENYNKFLDATKTLHLMMNDSEEMQRQVGELNETITRISERGTEISAALEPHQRRIKTLYDEYSSLKGHEVLFEKKEQIRAIAKESNAALQAVFRVDGRRPFDVPVVSADLAPTPLPDNTRGAIAAMVSSFISRATVLWSVIQELETLDGGGAAGSAGADAEQTLVETNLGPLAEFTAPLEVLLGAGVCFALATELGKPSDQVGSGGTLPGPVASRLATVIRRMGKAKLAEATRLITSGLTMAILDAFTASAFSGDVALLFCGTVSRVIQCLQLIHGDVTFGAALLRFTGGVHGGAVDGTALTSPDALARLPKAFSAALVAEQVDMFISQLAPTTVPAEQLTPIVVHYLRTLSRAVTGRQLTRDALMSIQVAMLCVSGLLVCDGAVDESVVMTEMDDAGWGAVNRALGREGPAGVGELISRLDDWVSE